MSEERDLKIRREASFDVYQYSLQHHDKYRGEDLREYSDEWQAKFTEKLYAVSSDLNKLLDLATRATELSPAKAKALLSEDPHNVRVRLHAALDILNEIGL